MLLHPRGAFFQVSTELDVEKKQSFFYFSETVSDFSINMHVMLVMPCFTRRIYIVHNIYIYNIYSIKRVKY